MLGQLRALSNAALPWSKFCLPIGKVMQVWSLQLRLDA